MTSEPPKTTNNSMAFDNGLTRDQDDRLDDLMINLTRVCQMIEELGRHRNYALAITKIEEAVHWLRDRKNKPA